MKIFSKIVKKCNCTISDLPGRFAIVIEFTFVASNEQLDTRAHFVASNEQLDARAHFFSKISLRFL